MAKWRSRPSVPWVFSAPIYLQCPKPRPKSTYCKRTCSRHRCLECARRLIGSCPKLSTMGMPMSVKKPGTIFGQCQSSFRVCRNIIEMSAQPVALLRSIHKLIFTCTYVIYLRRYEIPLEADLDHDDPVRQSWAEARLRTHLRLREGLEQLISSAGSWCKPFKMLGGGSTRYVRPYVDDSLSPGTSSPLCLSHFQTDLFIQRVYKRNGVRTYVFIDWSLDAMKDGLIVWLLWCMYTCLPTYVYLFVHHLQTCWLIFFLGDEGFSVLTFRSTPCAKFARETYRNDKMVTCRHRGWSKVKVSGWDPMQLI